ncbi:MAG: homoserine kinase [Verrucomicrobiota bacterium]
MSVNPLHSVTYQVPATSANLGPGFDALGVAVCLYNQVTVSRVEEPLTNPFFKEAASLYFKGSQQPSFHFSVEVTGEVPRSRGLGSSVTVRLGILLGLNALCGSPCSENDVLEMVIQLEGHPDNAVPAMLGGFCVSNGKSRFRAEVDERLKFLAIIPDSNLETSEAREVLPKRIDFSEAIENVQHACLITAAMATGKYEELQGHFVDRLHEPYRLPLIPGAAEAIEAAENAGALGAYLSGAGTTLMAVTLGKEDEIQKALTDTLTHHGHHPPTCHLLSADNQGALKI